MQRRRKLFTLEWLQYNNFACKYSGLRTNRFLSAGWARDVKTFALFKTQIFQDHKFALRQGQSRNRLIKIFHFSSGEGLEYPRRRVDQSRCLETAQEAERGRFVVEPSIADTPRPLVERPHWDIRQHSESSGFDSFERKKWKPITNKL